MEKLIKLQKTRDLIFELKEKREKILEEAKKDPVFAEIEQLVNAMMDLELEIREEAIKTYNETGEKKIGQIGIRIMKGLVYDEKVAFEWAKEHSLFLTLDKKAFERYAKDSDSLNFVGYDERVIATIPTKINIEMKGGNLK